MILARIPECKRKDMNGRYSSPLAIENVGGGQEVGRYLIVFELEATREGEHSSSTFIEQGRTANITGYLLAKFENSEGKKAHA